MKNADVFLSAILAAMLCISGTVLAATYGGGSGTAADPYQISGPGEMNFIGRNSGDWGKCFKLMADIDMSAFTGTQYNIIGNETTKFTGTFDGNGHKIRNLTYNTTDAVDYIGLFGYTDAATIKNLGLENVNLSTGGAFAGGLVGWQAGGTITNCYSTGSTNSSSSAAVKYSVAGGLVGYLALGQITNCYSTGAVTSSSAATDSSYAGGLVGYQAGTITSCYSTGVITSSSTAASAISYAGGLVGGKEGGPTTNCYSTGAVTAISFAASAISYAGGLVGSQASGTTTNCTSTGAVTSSTTTSAYTGGLVGMQYGGTIIHCCSTGTVTSLAAEGSFAGGFIGMQDGGTITNCCSTGTVTSLAAISSTAGGFIGGQESGTITNCCSTGAITASTASFLSEIYAGGLAGYSKASLSMCYSTGPVLATGTTVYKGGLLGYILGGTATACFWDTQTSGLTTSAGGSGAQGKTTAEMRTLSTFTAAGWDFSATDGDPADWQMPANSYPKLAIPGDIADSYGVNYADFAAFAAHWMQTGCPAGCGNANLDNSGTVDVADLVIFADNWLKGI